MHTDEHLSERSDPDVPRTCELDEHDVTLLEENLRLTPDQRFEKFMRMLAFVQELRRSPRIEPRG